MSVKLQKGQKVSLSKEQPGLSKIMVGLGWDEVRRPRGLFSLKPQDIDCDAFAILLTDGKLANAQDIVYFGNLTHESGAVKHRIPRQYDRIVLAVNIYKAFSRRQHFGMVQNAFIRLVDGRNNKEMCIYNLTENYSGMTAMLFGEVYRYNGEWKFSAIGQGTKDGSIVDFAKRYL